jgi:hypothetical protein
MAALPSAATLQYFDNSNSTPAPYGVQVPFNNEQQDVWLGYDSTTGQLCITNFSRTTTLICFSAAVSAFNYSVAIAGVLVGDNQMNLTATPSVGAVGDYSWTWTIHSNNAPVTGFSNPGFGVVATNTAQVINGANAPGITQVKCRTTHTLTGTIAENYYLVILGPANV